MSSPWAEIDHGAIAWNVASLRRRLAPGARLLVAVKSGGYGHGCAEVARTALRHGAFALGVARLEEGIELREAGIGAPILVFGATPADGAAELLRHQLTATVTGAAHAHGLAAALPAGASLPVHLKLDSGMGRLGLPVHDEAGAEAAAAEAVRIAAEPRLRLQGAFTHFASSDDPSGDFTMLQHGRFGAALAAMERRGIRPVLRHAANSAAILAHPGTHLDLVRAGIAAYGLAVPRTYGLRPAMALKTRIVQLQAVPAGATIGYGSTHRTAAPTVIATVAIGYGDGYDRAHSGRGRMLVRGRSAPVVGRVCMDLTMLDVGGIAGVAVGDEVVVFGRQGDAEISADEVAASVGSIPYETVTALTPRVRRLHRDAPAAALSALAA